MEQAPSSLSLTDLIAHAKAKGYPLRRDQVVRWHKAGLVPRPRRQWLGQGKGSRSLGYPPEALQHVLAVLLLLRRRPNLKWAGWVMWLAGFPVTAAVRVELQRVAARAETEIDTARQELEMDQPPRSSRKLFRTLSMRTGLRKFGLRLERFRGKDAGEFDTALHLILGVLSGIGVEQDEIVPDQIRAMERMLAGMGPHASELTAFLQAQRGSAQAQPRTPEQHQARRRQRAGVERWRQQLKTALSDLSHGLGTSVIRSGRPLPEDLDLERRREECIALWTVLNAQGASFRIPLGPPASLFLLWYVFRHHTTIGTEAQLFRSESWKTLEPLMVALFRLDLETSGLPLPLRTDRRATLLPLTLEEHPDAHLVCRPIEVGKRRRSRRQRVRPSPRR